MFIYITLAFIGIALIGLIVVYGAIQYRTFRKELKFLYWYFVYDFATSLLSVIIAFQQVNNHWIAQLQIPVFYGWFVVLFSGWVRTVFYKKFMRYSFPLLFLLWGSISVLTPSVWIMYDVVTFPVAFVLLISFAILVIIETMKEGSSLITKEPQFWICTGLIIYSITTITSMMFARQLLVVSMETLSLVWTIRNVISIIGYACFFVGFIRGKNTKKETLVD